MKRLSTVVLIGICLAGCADGLVAPDAPDTPEAIFEQVWTEIDRRYSHFGLKEVDWDAVYVKYRSSVGPSTSERDLYTTLCRMMAELEDGHVNLFTPSGRCGYTEWFTRYPRNFSLETVKTRYLNPDYQVSSNGRLVYGWLNDGVGYLHIASFSGTGWDAEVDAPLRALSGARAIVVDVRDNGGGSGGAAERIAGRFAEQEALYAYYRYRDGKEHDAFTEREPMYVRPYGDVRYNGPVALLTNRSCFSACESFALAMGSLSDVTVIGDTTGGGLGNPIFRELGNGWTYRFPVWIQSDARDRSPEGIGIGPDEWVTISPAEASRGIDPILQRALDVLH